LWRIEDRVSSVGGFGTNTLWISPGVQARAGAGSSAANPWADQQFARSPAQGARDRQSSRAERNYSIVSFRRIVVASCFQI
jgi:hypothetical protein